MHEKINSKNSNFKHEKYYKELEDFENTAYEKDDMLPRRYVYILTNLCNLSCDFCFQVRKKLPGAMTADDWISFSNQLPPYARVTFTGGEPLVFKDFNRVFHEVAKKFECNMICNGLRLDKEKIDLLLSYKNFKVLSISIDSVDNTVRKIANKNPKIWNKEWSHAEEMCKYFIKRRDELQSDCKLDAKTVILDEYAHELLDIHKYCIEKLGFDTHCFTFLKGSPVQNADYAFEYKKIFEKSKAPVYKNFDVIKKQLDLIKQYNSDKDVKAFLNPKVISLNDNEIIDDNLDIINDQGHKNSNFKPCKSPWASMHINADGSVFPCLSIDTGNVKKQSLNEIFYSDIFKKFRQTIKNVGTVAACNRCCFLKIR
jgi:MoaA/NifB/PqqE/SkfB family radical SAM enzyme